MCDEIGVLSTGDPERDRQALEANMQPEVRRTHCPNDNRELVVAGAAGLSCPQCPYTWQVRVDRSWDWR